MYALSVPSLFLLLLGLGSGIYSVYNEDWLQVQCGDIVYQIGILRLCSNDTSIHSSQCNWTLGNKYSMGFLPPLQFLSLTSLCCCALITLYMLMYICALRKPSSNKKALDHVPIGLASGCFCSAAFMFIALLKLKGLVHDVPTFLEKVEDNSNIASQDCQVQHTDTTHPWIIAGVSGCLMICGGLLFVLNTVVDHVNSQDQSEKKSSKSTKIGQWLQHSTHGYARHKNDHDFSADNSGFDGTFSKKDTSPYANRKDDEQPSVSRKEGTRKDE